MRPEVLVPIVLLASVLGYPLFLLVAIALNAGDPEDIPPLEFGFNNLLLLGDHTHLLWNTLAVAGAGTVLATVMATILAWILHRTNLPRRSLFEALILIPYPVGPLVGALAWNILGAPRTGMVNQAFSALTGMQGPLIDTWSPAGIVFVMAIFDTPAAVLIIGAAMQRMDPSLEECSAVLGARPLGTAFRITLPLMLPAIASAAVFLFVSMISEFSIPAILGAGSRFYVVTTAIYNAFQGYPPNYPLAAVLGIVLILFTVGTVWLSSRLLGRRTHAVVGGRAWRPRRIDLGGWTWVAIAVVLLYLAVAVALPMLALVMASLQGSAEISWSPSAWSLSNYTYILFDFPTTRRAILNSLMLGVGTGTIGVACAVFVAVAVHRSRGPGRGLLEQMAMLPQAFPRLVFAVGLMWMFLMLPIPLYGSLAGVLFAYVIVFLPLAFRSMSGVVVQLDAALEEAARVSGAGWRRTMRTITIPLLRSGIVATWILLFMVSVREVSASLFLAGPRNPVLGPSILNFWESGGLPHVSTLAVVQAAIILAALFLARRFARDPVL